MHITRREFTKSAAATAILGSATIAMQDQTQSSKPRFRKAVKLGMVNDPGATTLQDRFQLLADLGYDGVELDSPNDLNNDEVLAARDTTGLDIHGVVCSEHWRSPLSHPDPAVAQRCVDAMLTAVRDAKTYGASTVLLVPAVVNKDVSYYDAWHRSQAELRKIIPLAKELDITIAFENVWNNFLLSPLEASRYMDQCRSSHVGWYFDVGNVVNFGWPEHWISVLRDRLVKLDIKDFSRSKRDAEGLWKGFHVKLGEGDADWPAVCKALQRVDYLNNTDGWATAEVGGGDRTRLADIKQRMDAILSH